MHSHPGGHVDASAPVGAPLGAPPDPGRVLLRGSGGMLDSPLAAPAPGTAAAVGPGAAPRPYPVPGVAVAGMLEVPGMRAVPLPLGQDPALMPPAQPGVIDDPPASPPLPPALLHAPLLPPALSPPVLSPPPPPPLQLPAAAEARSSFDVGSEGGFATLGGPLDGSEVALAAWVFLRPAAAQARTMLTLLANKAPGCQTKSENHGIALCVFRCFARCTRAVCLCPLSPFPPPVALPALSPFPRAGTLMSGRRRTTHSCSSSGGASRAAAR